MNKDQEIAELQKKYSNVMKMELVFKIDELKKELEQKTQLIKKMKEQKK